MNLELKTPQKERKQEKTSKKQMFWQKAPFRIILFLGLLYFLFPLFNPPKEVIDFADYTANGRSYRVSLEGRGEMKQWTGESLLEGRNISHQFQLAKELVIYEKAKNAGKWREKKRYNYEGIGPWCVAIGQMDDKSDIEVFVGAYRATRYFPEGTRPYIFTWNHEKQELLRLWTGSYFDSPLFIRAEFIDYDQDGYDEIKILETMWALEDCGKKYESYYGYSRKTFQPYLKQRCQIEETEN